jgi:putative acetyltransferase
MPIRIRPFQEADAPALVAMVHASVHAVGSRDYSPAQVFAWSPATADAGHFIRRASDGRIVLVAIDGAGEPVGYGDLEADGHIDHLYCRPDAVGAGVGSALYDRLEAAAVKLGLPLIYAEASEAARRLLERKGFAVEARRNLVINGVAIHNFRMTKALAPGVPLP